MFTPLILSSNKQDPYKGVLEVKREKEKQINGINYTKISYKKDHGLLWRIGNCFLGILASLSIIPLIVDFKNVRKIFKCVKTGEEIKVVLIPKDHGDKTEPKSILKKSLQEKTKPNKHVDFNQARGRVFNKAEKPQAIGEANSIQMIDLQQKASTLQTKQDENPPKSEKTDSVQMTNSQQEDSTPGAAQTRRIPPVGIADTVFFKNGKVVSVHGKGELFQDNEILEMEEIIKTKKLDDAIEIFYTKYDKPILQQQATRGCTAAAAGMLILDRGGTVDLGNLRHTNLGDSETIMIAIKKAGFKSIITNAFSDNYLADLRNLIDINGSAIVSISGELGGHVVVVDHVSLNLDKVRLRDPYHGWEITVSGPDFMKRNPTNCIQIVAGSKD